MVRQSRDTVTLLTRSFTRLSSCDTKKKLEENKRLNIPWSAMGTGVDAGEDK